MKSFYYQGPIINTEEEFKHCKTQIDPSLMELVIRTRLSVKRVAWVLRIYSGYEKKKVMRIAIHGNIGCKQHKCAII